MLAGAPDRTYPGSMPWSDDARVMAHPFQAYAELAASPEPWPRRALAARVARILVVLAGFVSLTAAGRLVAFHVVGSMVAWSFVPAVQAAVFALVLRLLDPARPRAALAPALSLYFTGHGPWLIFLLLIAGVCLFSPDVYTTMMGLLRSGALPFAMLGVIAWSMVLTYACFLRGLGFPKGRARGATALFYAGFTVAIVGYYLSMNEIQPQAPWAP
jgi:hypothetical protein